MPLAIDQDDTQVLDANSPHSGGDDFFMGGETLPIHYGETQRVDSCDDQLGDGFQDWGKTQVVDEFEETGVVRDGDEDGGGQSERTELVVDEDGLVDDFVGEVGSGVRAKEDDLVDPDASTDEDEGGGSAEPAPSMEGRKMQREREMEEKSPCTPKNFRKKRGLCRRKARVVVLGGGRAVRYGWRTLLLRRAKAAKKRAMAWLRKVKLAFHKIITTPAPKKKILTMADEQGRFTMCETPPFMAFSLI